MKKKNELNFYEREAQRRIIELIDEFAEGSRAIFAQKTGINKGSISQYCNGKNSPSNLTAEKIASAFGVNPVWVMGFSVPKYIDQSISLSENDDLIVSIEDLTPEHRQAVLSYIDFLMSVQRKEEK